MAKITMKVSVSMRETFDDFLLFKKSMGLSEKTLKTYKEHLLSIRKHLPIDNPMDSIEKTDLEKMISSMRDIGLSSNSIQSYTKIPRQYLKIKVPFSGLCLIIKLNINRTHSIL